mmetsp:Transcript_8403/g.19786  ORF Transcript_8403/g.19786 Transcript_8403/m.19786 type:complete len:221 (+) Transcript_8403:85-747(+)
MGNRQTFSSECCAGNRDDTDMNGNTFNATSAASQHEEEMVNVAKHSAVRAVDVPKRFLMQADAEDYAKGEYLVPQALIEAPSGNKDRVLSGGSDAGNGQSHGQDAEHGRSIKEENTLVVRSGSDGAKGEDTRWLNAVLNREGQEQLGLSISWAFPETCLTVSHIGSGAVERWNTQNPEAAIAIGDAILSVNEISDPCEAAREMSMQSVVRLRLQRKAQEE